MWTTAETTRRIATAAALIAGLTVLTRLAGFVRTLVFAGAVGTTDLGDIYQTANTIPNIIFEVVAGGALTVIVVPLLAGAIADGDRRRVGAITSALLTWTLVLLVPLAALVSLLADPIVGLLAGDTDPAAVATGGRMLRVFAVQLPLYGIGVVLTGVLHAHRRFLWPVAAPLLSSAAVIAAYAAFAAVEGPGTGVADVSRAGVLILSVGTTLAVVVLTLCQLIPMRSLGLTLRPSLALGGELRRRATNLAGAAVVTVAAQQVATAYLIRLANDGPDGTLVLFVLAQAVFLLPWAVFAVPLSTPTFPVLAEAAATADVDRFDATLSRTTRAVLLASGLGVAGLVALAGPLAVVLSAVTATHPPVATLAGAIVAFAPGLPGYALFALLNRALSAAGRAHRAALAAVAGWTATMVAAVILAVAAPEVGRVVVLGAATSVGMTVLGGACLLAVALRDGGARHATDPGFVGPGTAALSGFGRSLAVTVGGAVVAGWLGWAAGRPFIGSGVAAALGGAVVAGLVVAVVFITTVVVFDRHSGEPLVGVLRRRGEAGARVGKAESDIDGG
jgi:putative peptidoglycan lipid II flippase